MEGFKDQLSNIENSVLFMEDYKPMSQYVSAVQLITAR